MDDAQDLLDKRAALKARLSAAGVATDGLTDQHFDNLLKQHRRDVTKAFNAAKSRSDKAKTQQAEDTTMAEAGTGGEDVGMD